MAKETAPVPETEDPKPGPQDEGNDVEARLGKLEKANQEMLKALEEERKASAGKDKKITELAEEKKKLQEATYSKDKILEIREKELEDKNAAFEAKRFEETKELEKLRIELDKRLVIDQIEGFPKFLADRVHGTTPDEIKADVLSLMNHWVRDRDKADNARKVGPKPQSGGGKQLSHTAEDVAAMTPDEKRRWAETASKEEFDAIFDKMHGGT